MSGFGDGPFGSAPFGESAWAKQVLYDYLPAEHRAADANNGYALLAWSLAVGHRFEKLRPFMRSLPEQKDPLQARSRYQGVARLRLGPLTPGASDLEQAGVDGSVNAAGEFTAPSLRLKFTDRDKTLRIKNSLAGNTGAHVIATVTGVTSLLTDAPLATEAGPLRWEIEALQEAQPDVITIEVWGGFVGDIAAGWTLFDGASRFEVVGRRRYSRSAALAKKLNDRQGSDGVLDELLRLVSPTAAFRAEDLGRKLWVASGPDALDGAEYEITHVVSADTVSLGSGVIHGAEGTTYEASVGYLSRGVTGVTVEHTNAGPSLPLAVSVVGLDVSVQLATDALGFVTSTAQDVVAAVRAHPQAGELLRTDVWFAPGLGTAGVGRLNVPVLRVPDEGDPLFWSVSPREQIDVRVVTPPRGMLYQRGVDGAVAGDTFTAASAEFAVTDVGKMLELPQSSYPHSLGPWRVVDVLTPTQVRIARSDGGAVALPVEAGLSWELRTEALPAAPGWVEVYPQPMLDLLAQDFGVEVDERDSELVQRSWVRNTSQWIQRKGGAEGYAYVAKLSGYSSEVSRLYRVDPWWLPVLPPERVLRVGDATPGKIGLQGSFGVWLHPVTGIAHTTFTATDAAFDVRDTGRVLRVLNAAVPGNNKHYVIEEVLSATEVRFRSLETAVLPDPQQGALSWVVLRLYTDLPPRRPRYDEIVVETLEEIVPVDFPGFVFQVDRFCWEADFKAEVSPRYANILAVVPVTQRRFKVTYELLWPGQLIASVGAWSFTDDSGGTYWFDTVPVEVAPGIWEFEAITRKAPVVGPMSHKYHCPEVPTCDYCPSNKVLVRITPEDVGSAEDLEGLFNRALRRMELPKPIHVEVILLVQQVLEASFSLGATIEPHGDIEAVLLAPFGALFDELEADLPEWTDVGIGATIEPTLP